MSRLRVVNLGLPKSGTTTLARALWKAGLKVADYRIRPRQGGDPELHGAYVAALMYRGYFETGDPLAHLEMFDAFSEISSLRDGLSLWPQMDFGLLRAIRAHHPGVKFVASRRDAFALSQSMLAWTDMGMARIPRADIPGLPQGYGATSKERMQWIEAHYANLRQVFAGDDVFMDYDVTDTGAAGKIAAHIGRDLPWWGRLNASRLRRSSGPEAA